jgi:hypothetical protein
MQKLVHVFGLDRFQPFDRDGFLHIRIVKFMHGHIVSAGFDVPEKQHEIAQIGFRRFFRFPPVCDEIMRERFKDGGISHGLSPFRFGITLGPVWFPSFSICRKIT